MEYKYQPMDPSWKKCSDVAPYRLEVATAYREARKKSPAMARLLFRRMRSAKQKMKDAYMDMCCSSSSGNDHGGLASLLPRDNEK